MNKDRQYFLKKSFFDDEHYPYGLDSSGDFSIKEAKLITQYGNLARALMDGRLSPENSEDKDLLAICRNEKVPTTDLEKAWAKYLTKINEDGYIASMSLSTVRDGEETDFSEGGSDYDDD
ncbi:DUF413 domain-containing protein [Pokkaliibacter sp. MBI-7]|uniref:Macrodomain Ori protein n=1 Tax=Proteobacteria bacterium 228 TaxID=2083153 RepID=A0A2S5KLT8_9PROT|nr:MULTISPECIES: DUF413 domain-containing protein [Pokkaliibacter]MDH2432290.1 DUF413 domain-containing protein [Pokkaliibacter sp. MBI-7]PPC75276.1 hypothetical protein C4K68_21820 [Pokkaliibacter plantistimulans]